MRSRTKIKLKQSGFLKSYVLTLTDSALIYNRAEGLSHKRTVRYVEILAVLRDQEQTYLVLHDVVLEFKNQQGQTKYEVFIRELLRRLEQPA